MTSVITAMRNYLIISALLPVVLLWNPPPGPKTSICTSTDCRNRGSLYASNILPHGNPCVDFYEFACGSWSKQNPRPVYELEWDARDALQRETLDKLQIILKTPDKSKDSLDLLRAKRVFKICMKIPSVGRGDVGFLENIKDKVGSYPQTSVWDIHNGYVKMTGESPLFDIQIMANNKHKDEPLLQFKDINSPFGSLVLRGEWSSEQKSAYLELLVSLVKTLHNRKQPGLQEKALFKIAKEVMNFRFELNKISRASLPQQSDPWEPMTPKDLQQWYNRNIKQTKTAQIPWEPIVRNLYSGIADSVLSSKPTVGIRRKAYFIALAKLLATTSEETLAYHSELYFAERHMKFTSKIQKTLDELVANKDNFMGYVRNEEMEKSLQCIRDINMDEALGKIYVDIYYNKKNVPAVKEILEDLRNAMKTDVTSSKWMDSETKASSIRKINDLNWWIGYPPWYNNPKLKTETTLMKPATVTANLNSAQNRLGVNAALMQSPLLDASLPDAINYGAFGTILGQEMYHVLADCAKLKSDRGDVTTLWSKALHEKCHLWSKCFVGQHTRLQLQELKSYHLSPAVIEVLAQASGPPSTFNEDLADVMSLQVAYHAYQGKLKKQKNTCTVLPYFEGFNCDQMFFISYANSMCGSQVPEIAYSKSRTHSSFRLRVNAAVSNNEDFARAFGCTASNPMSPPKKCNLWV